MTYKQHAQPYPAGLYSDVQCDGCEVELQPVEGMNIIDPENGFWRYLQAENSMVVTLGGPYGGFIDTMKPYTFIICGECATNLLKTFPLLLARIEEDFMIEEKPDAAEGQ